MKRTFKILLFCISCLALISWDKATKNLAKQHLKNQGPISYLHDTFRLQYVENTGAAMSLGDDLPKAASFWLLSIIPMMILTALFVYVLLNAKKLSMLQINIFSLIIAGGMGNILDRLLFDRHVTDFMNIGLGNIRTGIFNVADVCVTAGVIGLFIMYRKKELSI